MIPAIAASAVHALHHALSSQGGSGKAGSGTPFQLPTAAQAQAGAGSIASDLGQLGDDLMGMLGMGGGKTAQQGAQAYARAGSLGQ